jgi:hypothetical protein
MEILLFVIILLLNFAISYWNAYAVGLAWVETKHAGGWPRFMAWMGAIMSASGFSWCYLIVLVVIGHGLKVISLEDVPVIFSIGYILLIPGILFSGLMIMVDSWARAYRTRTVRDIGIAAWNTYAEIHNVYHAIKDLDKAFGHVVDEVGKDSGSGSGGNDKNKGAALVIVIAIVIVALLAGVLTTAVIIARSAGNDQLGEGPIQK